MKKFKTAKLAAALLFSAAAAIAALSGFPAELEYTAKDAFYRRSADIPTDITIIAIDEQTLSKLGPYSEWDRSVFAELLDILNTSETERPEVIGMDIIFSGSGNEVSDHALAEAAGKYGNVITASKLNVSMTADRNSVTYVFDEVTAYDELSAVTGYGFTVPVLDSDGYIRRSYGKIDAYGKTFTSFAVKVAEAMGYNGSAGEVFEFSYSGKPGDFETVPMSAVLNGTVPASYFYGKTVLIGAYEEGMMDAYSVPVDHSKNMYGVEIQANIISALINGKLTHTMPAWLRALIAFTVTFAVGTVLSVFRLRTGAIVSAAAVILYPAACSATFLLTSAKADITCVPVSILLMFGAMILISYNEVQYKRSEEMREMLFSMADSMAEAIEARTPYNANHTKNVARMCVEMTDRINLLHRKGRTELHFSDNDRGQIYLAAMLHDIGKMDVPTTVMDKPTKLGDEITSLRDRLSIISLKTRIDKLCGNISAEAAENTETEIKRFLEQLDGFDCGRPLNDTELAYIDEFGSRVYRGENGEEIPFLTKNELECLKIKAGTLSESEREIMKNHVVYTDKILSHVLFGERYDKVRRIAADHHEFLNGKGYPLGKTADSLDSMTRILTIMDIYDSLIAEDRPYKKPKTVSAAFAILDEEAAAGKIDKELLEIAKSLYLKKEKIE